MQRRSIPRFLDAHDDDPRVHIVVFPDGRIPAAPLVITTCACFRADDRCYVNVADFGQPYQWEVCRVLEIGGQGQIYVCLESEWDEMVDRGIRPTRKPGWRTGDG